MFLLGKITIHVGNHQNSISFKIVVVVVVVVVVVAQHILSMFLRIESLVPPNGKMLKLINYVCLPWIELPVYHITLPFGHYRSGEVGGGGGLWGTVPFTLPFVLDSLYDIRVVVSGSSSGNVSTLLFILLLKHLITQILCQGSIIHLLQVNTNKS